MDKNKTHRSKVLFESLLSGQHLPLLGTGTKCKLFKPGEEVNLTDGSYGVVDDDKHWLGYLCEYQNSIGEKGEGYMGMQMSIEQFLSFCNTLTEDDYAKIASDVVLMEYRRGDYTRG